MTMNPDRAFAAQMIDAGSGGFAGLATSLLFEREPDLARRFGADAFGRWREQLGEWLQHLVAALDADEPALFEARIRWTREAFESRQVDVADLRAALEALREVLAGKLPEAAAATTVAVLDPGLASLGRPSGAASDAGLSADDADGRLALGYLQSILEGRPREAIDDILAEIAGGKTIRDAYLLWLLPAQREAGRLWHAGELSIAEERLVSSTTQRLMALLCERARPSRSLGRTVLLACVSRNVHELGVRAIADFFEMAGWRALHLGADVPPEEIAKSVSFFGADLVVLAATLDTQLRAVQQTIQAVRALEEFAPKIIVGGPIFAEAPELWRKLGADGYAATIGEAEPLGRRLTD